MSESSYDMSPDERSEMIGEFLTESDQHLTVLNKKLLQSEDAIKKQLQMSDEDLNAMFRAAHTIKGTASFIGLTKVVKLTHEMETILQRVQTHQMPLTSQIIDVLFGAFDVLGTLFEGLRDNGEERGEIEESVERIKAVLNADVKSPSTPAPAAVAAPKAEAAPQASQEKPKGAIEDKLDCKTADIISTFNKLLADEEVKQAAIDQPPSSEEQGLNQIIDQHNVRIVNKSFGPLTSSTLDSFFEKKGCGDSIMSTNFRLNGQIDSKREAKLRMDLPEDSRAKTVLTLESSGNEGEEINSYSDSLKCPDSTDKNTILVGSSNYSYYSSNNRSFFSNHGKCVKYHVLGHEVKVPTGLGFYNVVSGTSFSAPLLARYITLNIDGNSSNEEMIAFLDSKADKDGFIERDEDMTELSWNHRVQTDRPIIATSQRASNLLNIKRINKFAKMPNLGR